MMRFIGPVILIGISIALFFAFVSPLYQDLSAIRREVSAYDEALTNSKALESERDKLTQKYNSIGAENLDRLSKFLPESVDNIRLILEIEKLAAPYGMALRDVKYDASVDAAPVPGAVVGGASAQVSRKGYGVWNLEFSTEGSYDNFINFAKDIENNLRVVDISSVVFSSNTGAGASANSYKYNFKIKTYWLKN